MLSAFFSTFPALPTVGHSFIEALRYYGKEFDAAYLSVVEGRRILIKSMMTPELFVYDVFLPDVNAAASVTLFDSIKLYFGKAYDLLCVEPIVAPLLSRILPVSPA